MTHSQLFNLSRFFPRMADKPYTTDIWLETAFRHPIGIPDDVFPVAWRGFGMTTEDER